MSSPTTPEELLDLKLLPAWVNEPHQLHKYADFEGDDERPFRHGERKERRDRRGDGQRRSAKGPESRDGRPPQSRDRRPPRRSDRERGPRRSNERPQKREEHRARPVVQPLAVEIRFLPHPPPFNSVVAQIKSGLVAYSVFALARLFLEKPERYNVKLTVAQDRPLFQLGDHGAVSSDRGILEGSAFVSSRDEFYNIEVSQTEPLKGNFTNVARCRLSGTLLGPTNHHNYQPQLRNLYETRFSRRMSFDDYQKQVEIVSDPAIVEEWKEQARNITTYTTKAAEPPVSFTNPVEVERHFRLNHLPGLIRTISESTIDGGVSRRLTDRALRGAIEDAWVAETRSPSKMMQELVAGFRQAGLHIFRHRRGMLFVSPVRARSFSHESTGVSDSINRILEKIKGTPGINLKQLAEQLAPAAADPADHERAKLSLATDLHWLVSEGYVIEFNDGSLDLPKAKPPVAPATEENQEPAVEVASDGAHVEVQPESVTESVQLEPRETSLSEAVPISVAAEDPGSV